MTPAIAKYNKMIQRRVERRTSLREAICSIKLIQNDLGSQRVMDAIQVLVEADKRYFNEIKKLRKRINVLFEQPRC